jgi:hypothetical protein
VSDSHTYIFAGSVCLQQKRQTDPGLEIGRQNIKILFWNL